MRVALAQISIHDEKVDENLNKIREIIENVDADLVVFPEYSTSMTQTLELAKLDPLLEASRGKIAILGSIIRQGNKRYDAAIVIENGKIVAIRKKRYLFKPLGEDFDEGEMPFPLELKGFKTKILICYELRFPELFWDADLFIVIGAWPVERVEHWKTLLKARAIESLAYVLGVNRWGKGAKAFLGGNSCAFDPWGKPLACLGFSEGVAIFEMDITRVQEAKSFIAFYDRMRVRKELFDKGTEH